LIAATAPPPEEAYSDKRRPEQRQARGLGHFADECEGGVEGREWGAADNVLPDA
jgi:hypothetical protein